MTAGGRNTGGVMRSSSAALGAGLHLPPQTGLSGGSGSWIHHSGQLRATVITHWERNFLRTFKKERCNREGGGRSAGNPWGSRLCLCAPRCLRNSDLRLILKQTSPEACGPPRWVAQQLGSTDREKRPLIGFWSSLRDEA